MLVLNLQEFKREHDMFEREFERDIDAALLEAKDAGLDFVQRKPQFNPQTGGTQAATSARILRRGGKNRILRMRNTKKHAFPLELGARPHIIRPRKPGGTLVFFWKGKLRFFKSVNHPGNRPYRFLSRSRNRAGIEFMDSMKRRMARAARRF